MKIQKFLERCPAAHAYMGKNLSTERFFPVTLRIEE
jgi:hypothetical protein